LTKADETLQAKHTFEQYAQSHCIKVDLYHASNGNFAETMWLKDVAKECQFISFCAVNDEHHQNGVAEKCIHDTQDMARSQGGD
jgi:hypothetical protein